MNHPQVIGCPGKIQILDHLLKYITSKEDVWVATGTGDCRMVSKAVREVDRRI